MPPNRIGCWPTSAASRNHSPRQLPVWLPEMTGIADYLGVCVRPQYVHQEPTACLVEP